MSKKQILQRIDLIEKQLTILTLYKKEFLEHLGRQGVENFVNNRLDELSKLYKLIDNE